MNVTVQQITTIRHEYRVANPSGHADMRDAQGLAERHASGKKISTDHIFFGADSAGLVVYFDETLQSFQRPEGSPETAVIRQ